MHQHGVGAQHRRGGLSPHRPAWASGGDLVCGPVDLAYRRYVPTRELPCSASSLLTGLLDRADEPGEPGVEPVEVSRTRVSVHYETGDPGMPMLSMCTPEAVRLPNAVVTKKLPSGSVTVRAGRLSDSAACWRVARWWRPARPRGLAPPPVRPVETAGPLDPEALVGAGPGLTPVGDDVLAGALVAAHAIADPRLPGWQRAVRRELGRGRTTAVSRAMLLCALDGYATDPLAQFVGAVCASPPDADMLDRTRSALLAVGHTSGAGLVSGVLHVLTTSTVEAAA